MTDNLDDDQMAPGASPGQASKKTGVRRVNNLPMYLIAGVMAVFLGIMVMVASDRSQKQTQQPQGKEEKAGSTTMFANEIAGNQMDGIIPAQPPKALEVPDLSYPGASNQTAGTILVARPDNLEAPPTPPISSGGGMAQNMSQNEDLNRIRMMKLQLFEEAVKAKTSVQNIPARSSGSAPGGAYGGAPGSREEAASKLAAFRQEIDAAGQDPTAAYKARLAQIQGSLPGGQGGGKGSTSAAPQLVQAAATTTVSGPSGQGDRWQLDSRPEPPRTPFELRAGFVIPATLISGINSELPGQITAQVSQTVYDTATGKYPLVPQGSRLVGNYSSEVAYGQARVLVAWMRIVFPDGKAMDIGSMPGADSAGYSGFNDKVNNHYVRLFGSALLMSGVTAGITYSQRDNQSTTNGAQTASSALSEALGQQIGQVTAQLIAKNMNIAPTLEIRPGYRLNVIVTKDLTFSKPYQSFDY